MIGLSHLGQTMKTKIKEKPEAMVSPNLIELLFLIDVIEVLLLLERKHIASPFLMTEGIASRS